MHRLTPLLAPRSIAFVGASPRPDTPGNDMLAMIARAGFTGETFLVNPGRSEINGRPCYASLGVVPKAVDLAVLAVPNARLEEALADAAANNARAAVIFASGHLAQDRSPPLVERLAAIARAAGMPVCGANCMGFYNDAARVWACGFSSSREVACNGGITLISHAGAVFGALAHHNPRLRFNLAVSAGQELATTAADYLDYALEQPETRVIGLFLEAVRDPGGFVAALEKAVRKDIPIVILKVGRSASSAALAVSHSGAITGNDAAYAALFERHGVIRVDTLDEMASVLLLFEQGRRAAPGNVAVIQDSGGEREMMIDLAESLGLSFARIGEATVARLREQLEFGLEPVNPLDAWGTGREFVDIFAGCFSALLDDPDSALGIFFADIRDGLYIHDGYAEVCRRVRERTTKPVALATNYTQLRHRALAFSLTESGIPVLDGTAAALTAARHMLAHRDFRTRPADPPPVVRPGRQWRERLNASAAFGESEAMSLLADYGIPTLPTIIVESGDEAVAVARRIGFPAVCKTAAPAIPHKTERDGVRLSLADAESVRAAYTDLAARLGPRVLVTRMAESGIEMALGLVKDPQFGALVMVAAGGVFIEVMRDARHALAPFGPATARRLVDGLRLRPLLDGVRGHPPADLARLAEVIARFSVLAAELAEDIEGFDVNPLIVGPRGVVAVDALVIRKS